MKERILYTLTATEPTDADIADFSTCDTNFIVGNLERNQVQIKPDGSFTDPNNKQGAVFYDRNGSETMRIESSTVNKILSNYENGQIKP